VTALPIAVLLAASAIPGAASAHAPEGISCRVVDGTALKEGGIELSLAGAAVRIVDAHEMRPIAEATGGPDGMARFEAPELAPGHYLFRTERDGLPYFSDRFEVKEDGGPIQGRIVTYASTPDLSRLSIVAHHLIFRSHPGSDPPIVVVEEFVSVENRGSRTVRSERGPGEEHGFTYLARLPPAAGSVRAFLGEVPIPLEGGMGSYPLDVPFTPGSRTPLLLDYVLSLTKSHLVPWEPPFPVERLTVIVFDPDSTPVKVRGLSGPSIRTHEGVDLAQYDSSGPPDARLLEIVVQGPSRFGFWATVAAVVLAAVGLASLGTASSRRRGRAPAREILHAIAHLDLAFERGEVPREEYAPARKALLAQVVSARRAERR